MQINIAICDDEHEQISNLRNLILKWQENKTFSVNISGYEDVEGFLFSYPDNPCDLLLLDIEMNGTSGMELAKRLRNEGDALPIIFITGYSEFMSEGYDVNALHFLLKPVDEEKLFSVLDRYVAGHTDRARVLIIKSEDKIIHISPDDIVCIEAFGRKTELTMRDDTSIMCDMKLGYFEDIYGFIHTHRSYIVNMKYVKGIGKNEVMLDIGGRVPLSRRLFDRVNKSFIDYYTKSKG